MATKTEKTTETETTAPDPTIAAMKTQLDQMAGLLQGLIEGEGDEEGASTPQNDALPDVVTNPAEFVKAIEKRTEDRVIAAREEAERGRTMDDLWHKFRSNSKNADLLDHEDLIELAAAKEIIEIQKTKKDPMAVITADPKAFLDKVSEKTRDKIRLIRGDSEASEPDEAEETDAPWNRPKPKADRGEVFSMGVGEPGKRTAGKGKAERPGDLITELKARQKELGIY